MAEQEAAEEGEAKQRKELQQALREQQRTLVDEKEAQTRAAETEGGKRTAGEAGEGGRWATAKRRWTTSGRK